MAVYVCVYLVCRSGKPERKEKALESDREGEGGGKW
jgi:hypothetical protein